MGPPTIIIFVIIVGRGDASYAASNGPNEGKRVEPVNCPLRFVL